MRPGLAFIRAWRQAALVLGALLALAGPGLSGDAAAQTVSVAPASGAAAPSRVGRLSLVHGTVEASLEGLRLPAIVNLPVVGGLQLASDAQARVELRIGTMAAHLGPLAQLRVPVVQDDRVELALGRGALALHPRSVSAGQTWQVQAGAVGVRLLAPGSYHVVHQPMLRRVDVAVFEGSLAIGEGPSATVLAAGQRALLDPRDGLLLERGPAERSRFDEWAQQRLARSERGPAGPRTLSAELTGGEVLDDLGQWRSDPRLGPVWIPRGVDAEWAPFRHGRWVWMPPWGWHWVDEAAWGFATSHYGRWAFAAGRWAWVPGHAAATPVYVPATVGFFASGNEVIGWYPLGPGEAYRPTVPVPPRLLAALDGGPAPRSSDARHRYAQTSFAASALRRERFGAAQPDPADRVAVTPAALSGATALEPAALPLPTATSATGAEAPASPVPAASRPAAALRPLQQRLREAAESRAQRQDRASPEERR